MSERWLHHMINTGPARLDQDGVMVDSGEFVAALYESYAADQEYLEAVRLYPRYSPERESASAYAGTAEDVAEEVWERDAEGLAYSY